MSASPLVVQILALIQIISSVFRIHWQRQLGIRGFWKESCKHKSSVVDEFAGDMEKVHYF